MEGHGEITAKYLKTFFAMYHGIEMVDTIIASGTTTCYVFGFGENCAMSVFHQMGNKCIYYFYNRVDVGDYPDI